MMKALKAASGTVFGPFAFISSTTDHFDCDGLIYPRSVVGEATIEDYVPPAPSPPVEPVPVSVTNAQVRYIMRRTPYGPGTLLDAVDSAIRNSGDPDLVDFWDYANEFNRSSERVIALATALRLSSSDLDQLFISAKPVQL